MSCDENNYASEIKPWTEPLIKPKGKVLGSHLLRVLRQSKDGRRRARGGVVPDKITGNIYLTQYISYTAASSDEIILTYQLLVSTKMPTKSSSLKLAPTSVLLDTGTSVSLMPLRQARSLESR